MHWTNAVAIFIMIGSGWKIYDDDVIFGWLHFLMPSPSASGRSTGCSGTFSACGFLCSMDLLISPTESPPDVFGQTVPAFDARDRDNGRRGAELSPRHDDLTHYNAVQKILYLGIIADRHPHRDLRARAVEAGAILRACFPVRQFSDHPARPFPLHVRNRRISTGARGAGSAGAAKPRRHADRWPGCAIDDVRPTPPSKPRPEALNIMSLRPRTPSIFRPRTGIDQSVLTGSRALVDDVNRRNVLRGASASAR